MLTGITTFLIIFAVVGAILYGRKLAKNEKLDAVLETLKEPKVELIGLLLELVFYY